MGRHLGRGAVPRKVVRREAEEGTPLGLQPAAGPPHRSWKKKSIEGKPLGEASRQQGRPAKRFLAAALFGKELEEKR
jgi:hypothetical protein